MVTLFAWGFVAFGIGLTIRTFVFDRRCRFYCVKQLVMRDKDGIPRTHIYREYCGYNENHEGLHGNRIFGDFPVQVWPPDRQP